MQAECRSAGKRTKYNFVSSFGSIPFAGRSGKTTGFQRYLAFSPHYLTAKAALLTEASRDSTVNINSKEVSEILNVCDK